jgi:translocation and assembly module TamB
MTFTAVFQGREAKVTELRIASGPGTLNGKGFLAFPRGGEIDYRLDLSGKDFQVANLPEAQILSEPNLFIRGSEENFSLTGDILFSDFLISGTREAPKVQASRDVVVIRPEKAEAKPSSDFDLDIRVKISLGKKAFIRTAGLDAQLEGEVLILQKEANKTLAEGQIRVVDGSFAAFGTNLNVDRGHVNFTGGPADNPSLDILALRKVGRVRAGVRVTGTAELPEINLYSRPAMPDKDIVGFMFLGRRMRSDQEEGDLLALGAGALFPQGQGFFRRLGFTDIDLGGLFSEEGAVRLRYRLWENWEVESTLGQTSGVDLFHVIEFE